MKATVVGGGPAGLMAAEVLATHGFAVTIFEHKPSLGRKFLLAGRGGLNITHTEPLDAFLDRYTPLHPHLAAAIRDFGPDDLRQWCADLGEPTFVGTSGRVFPESFRATPLLRAWLARLDGLGVVANLRHRWLRFDGDNPVFADPDGTELEMAADVTVFALGGASWPRVGSDGSWVEPFRSAGIAVTTLAPANCGVEVAWSDVFREKFAGTPIKNAALSVNGHVVRGDPIVTARGLEGGPVYAHSGALRRRLSENGEASLHIDLFPDLTVEALAERLHKRRPKDSTSTWLRNAGLPPVAVSLLREVTANKPPELADPLARLAKAVPIPVAALMPIDRAISTAGGVRFDQVDDTFMLIERPGVFVVGEMLDWEAPTGGYLLQASFSTAVAAARAATLKGKRGFAR